MDTRETFSRGEVLGSDSRQLPADVYNLGHLLLVKSERDCLFVPIRSMQYIAVIDKEEIIFIDSMDKRHIRLSWKNFTPQVRESLTEPVPYSVEYYHPSGPETMQRLQGEYAKALHLLEEKAPKIPDGNKIITLSGKK